MTTTFASQRPLRAMRHLLLAAAALGTILPGGNALAAPFGWLKGDRVAGSGTVIQQTRNLAHFEAVKLGVAGNLELRIGNTESITVETDDNIAPLIETEVEDGTLKIRTTNRNSNIAPTRLRLIVQAKNISGLSVGGSGSINAASLRTPALRVDIGGSGSISVGQLDSDTVSVQLGGSGSLRAGGKTGALNVAIGGSGTVDTAQLQANTVQVNIGGSGQAEVWARQTLSASIGGSGDVRYYGDPQVSKSVHGSGSVSRRGAAPR